MLRPSAPASPLLQSVGFWEQLDPDNVDVPGVPLAVLVPLLVLGVLVVISLLSIGGYVLLELGVPAYSEPRRGDLAPHPRAVHDPRDRPSTTTGLPA